MSETRWTPEMRRVVLRVMIDESPWRPDTATDRTLAALADAGLLVTPAMASALAGLLGALDNALIYDDDEDNIQAARKALEAAFGTALPPPPATS